jgi:hypothetical protein
VVPHLRALARKNFNNFARDLGSRDPADLLRLARWVAEIHAARPSVSTRAERSEGPLDLVELAEDIYDDLFDMLQGAGWLDRPAG